MYLCQNPRSMPDSEKTTSKRNPWLVYGLTLAAFIGLGAWLVFSGQQMEHPTLTGMASTAPESVSFISTLQSHIAQPTALLLLQLISILFVARLFGYLFNRLGQPTVIGEILAGIVLGPSLLGHFFPDAYVCLFPPDSLNNIYYLSQIGLVLFMFVVGMELNVSTLKSRLSESFLISQWGIMLSFIFGITLAYFLYDSFAFKDTPFLSFALFIGVSMSITAFPVLARIIQEKDLTRTHLGTVALGSAAIDDVSGWCILAGVIAVAKTGSLGGSLYTLLATLLYMLFMLFVVRPFFKRLGEHYQTSEVVNKSMVAFVFLVLLLSAFITESLGIHALFGAFMAGVVMPPKSNFRRILVDKVEDVSVSLLLPLFFVFTGLRTEIGLLNSPSLWLTCGLIVLVAISGKLGGATLAARFMGENMRDSLSIGVLMNTRGLVELIILNIGYEIGILPPTLFAMLVIMALFTTFMTTPTLNLIERLIPARNKTRELLSRQQQGIFKALVAVGNPANGKILLNVAKTVLDGSKNSLAVNVLHATEGTDVNLFSGDQYIEDSFKGVRQEAESLGIPIQTEYKVTDNVSQEIVFTTNEDQYDFLLVGGGVTTAAQQRRSRRSLFKRIPFLRMVFNRFDQPNVFYPSSLIKDKTRYFIENSNCSVGVFMNRNFVAIKKTLIILKREEDIFLLRYGRRLLRNNPAVLLRIKDLDEMSADNALFSKGIMSLMKEFPDRVQWCGSLFDDKEYMRSFSFMMVSFSSWDEMVEDEGINLDFIPSTLIINKKRSRFHDVGKLAGKDA